MARQVESKVDSDRKSLENDTKKEPATADTDVPSPVVDAELNDPGKGVEGLLDVTSEDLVEARACAETLSLERTRKVNSNRTAVLSE